MQPLSIHRLNRSVINEPLGTVGDLLKFLQRHPRLFVITGAGISRASGIPTYRDEIGSWQGSTPIQHKDFIRDSDVRRRYWARSFHGWPNVGNASPNQAHRALVKIEQAGHVSTLVTQNIDRLHQKAGHRKVVDLHGRLDQVLCMDCGAISEREEIQQWLWQHNPQVDVRDWQHDLFAPDGDAEVDMDLVDQFRIPSCRRCDGMLKPNVVFYGSSVSKEVVSYLMEKMTRADAVLVVGTSLMVYSSFRFCKLASELAMPIACINRGLTRADAMLRLKVDADCGPTLSALASLLGSD